MPVILFIQFSNLGTHQLYPLNFPERTTSLILDLDHRSSEDRH